MRFLKKYVVYFHSKRETSTPKGSTVLMDFQTRMNRFWNVNYYTQRDAFQGENRLSRKKHMSGLCSACQGIIITLSLEKCWWAWDYPNLSVDFIVCTGGLQHVFVVMQGQENVIHHEASHNSSASSLSVARTSKRCFLNKIYLSNVLFAFEWDTNSGLLICFLHKAKCY